MSYGLFTVARDELHDPAALGRKLQTATGEYDSAHELLTLLVRAAEQDPGEDVWRIIPDPGTDPSKWRVEPVHQP